MGLEVSDDRPQTALAVADNSMPRRKFLTLRAPSCGSSRRGRRRLRTRATRLSSSAPAIGGRSFQAASRRRIARLRPRQAGTSVFPKVVDGKAQSDLRAPLAAIAPGVLGQMRAIKTAERASTATRRLAATAHRDRRFRSGWRADGVRQPRRRASSSPDPPLRGGGRPH
jgi:hypothetical protein